MVFDFTFWHFLTKPQQLAEQIQSSSMRGFSKRVVFVFLFALLLFAIQNIWGMGTEAITPLLSTMATEDYIIARFASLVGTIIWAFLYITFHLFGIAYIFSAITKIPFKHLLPLQLLVTGILLIEKVLIFLVFFMKGVTAPVSFLSLGPIAMTFLDYSYVVLFLNQLTIPAALIILLQYRYIRAYLGTNRRIIWIVLGIHLGMALITAAIGFMPPMSFLGGVGS